MTPREYAIKNNCKVIVYSNGMVWADGEIEGLEVIQDDMDNIFYPDSTSEWERMNQRGKTMSEEEAEELAKQISILLRDTLENVKKFYGIEDEE